MRKRGREMNSYGDGNTYRGTVCKDSEVPTIITDGKIAYSGKDYPVHTNGPWGADATHCRTAISSKGGKRKHVAMVNITKNPEYEITKEEHEANARLIAAAPEMLEVLRWLDAEMDCRDDDLGAVLFSREDFERVRLAINLAMNGE
jgi:hypothetical protein